MLEVFDCIGMGRFLFTQNEKNVRFYAHFGFKGGTVVPLPELDLRLYGMSRQPL
jgi:hypothetical protein